MLIRDAMKNGPGKSNLPPANDIEALSRKALNRLATPFASANHHECEFRAIKATSWHEIAFQYAVRAIRAVETGVRSGSREFAESSAFVRWVQKVARCQAKRKRRFLTEASAKEVAGRLGSVIGAYGNLATQGLEVNYQQTTAIDLRTQGLAVDFEELKGLAIRMQQELPRAWAFVYGLGNREFVRLDDAVYAIIESCADPSLRCAPRDAYFAKRNRDGLGPTKIASEWNAKAHAEKYQIAPRATGNVSASAVKKAIQRHKRALSDKNR